MKIYKRIFKEKRTKIYKAWYNPSSNFFYQFNPNMIHSDISEEHLKLSEFDAIKKGYYRIYVGNEINVESHDTPSEREFLATQSIIEKHSYKNITVAYWSAKGSKETYIFPKISFFLADDISDGDKKTY